MLTNIRLWKPYELENTMTFQLELLKRGISLDATSGHLFYNTNFLPLEISFELVFVRHGETYGNCGQITADGKVDDTLSKNHAKRIFQGNVNADINQLTPHGKVQAEEAALKLQNELLNKGWKPDIIFHSPLTRAYETGLPFIEKCKFKEKYFSLPESREMSFGSWDNRRVCDFSQEEACHLFYREQNALVKNSGINGNGKYQQAENFCEVLLRAQKVLLDLEKNYPQKKILLFSHSMFGAACNMLLGKGQKVENENYLAFDGQRKDGSHYVMPNATPFLLNFQLPSHLQEAKPINQLKR